MPHPLTEDQRHAATSPAVRLFIEAGPGAGKTTVAAERFGVARYLRPKAPTTGVVGLSFTYAATSELRYRITTRWGPRAIAHPSRVRTIDSELVELLCLLLRSELIRWPGGHTELDPLDNWGRNPYLKWNPKGYDTWVPALVDGEVTAVKAPGGQFRINQGDLLELLSAGLCTHADVRAVLRAALADAAIRPAVVEYRQRTVAHLLVDEVFDADELDLDLIRLHCEADIPVTVVGDRWQALYEWREAMPDMVSDSLLGELGFEHTEILHSHRYKTDVARVLAESVRGDPTLVPDVQGAVEIAIGLRWRHLWDGPAWILPTSFGQIGDQTDAVISLLLDHVLLREFDIQARSRSEALLALRLDPTSEQTWPAVMGGIEALLADTTEATAEEALTALRKAARDLGAHRQVAPRRNWREQVAVGQLQSLAARLLRAGPFTMGISAHQAKGQQWNHVGVCLADEAVATLAGGLDVGDNDHRTLYVALTRGSHSTGRIVGGPFD